MHTGPRSREAEPNMRGEYRQDFKRHHPVFRSVILLKVARLCFELLEMTGVWPKRPWTGLLDLPAEVIHPFPTHLAAPFPSYTFLGYQLTTYQLIQHIHLLALNPFLPQVSRSTHDILHSNPPTFVAEYLLSLYADYRPDQILVRALRHPVCTVAVAKEISRIWDRRRGYDPNPHPRKGRKPTTSVSTSPLCVLELPRRLFRPSPPPDPPIHPLITYLFTTYNPSPNSHKSYPLCSAVLALNFPLVTYLLEQGADPGVKENLAVEVAISTKNLRMVKMLVEYVQEESVAGNNGYGSEKGRARKRRRVEDRVRVDGRLVEAAMTKGSREIVQYFVHEKGEMSSHLV